MTRTRMPILAIGADPIWRARMRRIFAVHTGVEWLGSYASGEARREAAAHPAILLLDGDDVLTVRERRRQRLPAPARLYFFRHPDPVALQASLRGGGRGCLDKRVEASAMLRAVAAAETGLFVMSPQLLLALLSERGQLGGPLPEATSPADRWYGLTERQRQVVDCVASGLSNKQIARKLEISPETVKTHLHHVFQREGVHGRIALLADANLPST